MKIGNFEWGYCKICQEYRFLYNGKCNSFLCKGNKQ